MGGRTETQVERTETDAVRVEEFTYEETLRILNGNTSAQGLSPSEQAASQRSQEFNQFGLDDIFSGKLEDLTTYDATLGLFGKSRWNTTTDIQDSGFQYAGDWLAVKWDRARYAIGIKELGVYSAEYTDSSEFVSVLYSTPGPITKLSLFADIVIPKEFYVVDPLRSWIEFFITFDNGASFIPIAPISSSPSTSAKGTRLPVLVNVNSPLQVDERIGTQAYYDSNSEVKSCRLKVRFTRPEGTQYSTFTPILKGYKIKFIVGQGTTP